MPSKQQRDIEANLDADLARIGQGTERASVALKARRKRDTEAFVIPVSWVQPDPDQARKRGKGSDEKEIQELAESIREHGQMQPIEVRELKRDELYQIVTGEGRYTAISQILGLDEIKVRLIEPSEEQIAWRQLHENIHRRAFHPLDLAEAIEEAMSGGLKLAEVAKKLGKSEPWVQKARTVGKDLTDEARDELLKSDKPQSVDTAYEIATVEPEQQAEIAREVVEQKLTRDQVRERTKAAKRSGNSHRSGRTGRKAAKKPFELKWKADNGIVFQISSRKKNVDESELLEAAEAFVASLKPQPAAKAA